MTRGEKEQAFWRTLPGILTGIAAVITAVTGLVVGLHQYGALGPGHAVSRTGAVVPPGPRPGGEDPSKGAHATPPKGLDREPVVTITARDGTVTRVYADSFRHRQTNRELALMGGQTLSFDDIRSVDVIRVGDDRARVRVTLSDDRVVEGSIDAGLYPHGFDARNELGKFSIQVDHLKRIDFPR